MAEYLWRRGAETRSQPVLTLSGGLAAPNEPSPPHALAVMADRGIDMSKHRSSTLTAAMVANADLVLGMTGRHVREAAVLDLSHSTKIFTLVEFGRLSAAAGPRVGETVPEYVVRLGRTRSIGQLGSGGKIDDIGDPYKRRKSLYRKAAVAIEAEVEVILEHLYP